MRWSLLQLQRGLQQFLLHSAADSAPLIRAPTRASAQDRLGIYAEAYRARLLEALATDYAGLKKYLGDEVFETLGKAYIEQYPSRHFSLRWFGKMLPDLVASTAPYNQHIEIAELARFEWAQGLVFDAVDVTSMTIAELAAVAPMAWLDLRFELQPALQRLSLYSNAPLLWSALNDDAIPPPLEIQKAPVAWLVWRQDLRILFRELTPDEAAALSLLAAGSSFSDVCAQLCERIPESQVPGYAAGLLRHWIDAGLIKKIRDPE
ncbi:MAG: DNA-binding domain-containing protein [Spongiibacteraceae bacterium]